MGNGNGEGSRQTIDLFAVSGARALKRAGWSDEAITKAYGRPLPLHMTLDEIVAHNAALETDAAPYAAQKQVKDSTADYFDGDP